MLQEFRTNALNKCPHCGQEGIIPQGFPGHTGRTIMIVLFGIIGNGIASSNLKNRKDDSPFIFKCESCDKKFEIGPCQAPEDERLATPCTITVTRPGNFVGAAVGQHTFLNGIRMGILKNGSSLTFKTDVKNNLLYFTDLSGTVYKSVRRFIAEPGGDLTFRFNMKFKD